MAKKIDRSGFNPNTYIYYYFDNYARFGSRAGTSFTDINNVRRQSLLEKQLATFKQHERSLLRINDDTAATYEDILDPAFWNEIIIASQQYDVDVMPGQKLSSYSVSGNSRALAEQKADELANNIVTFSDNLKIISEQMYEKAGLGSNYQEYMAGIANKYAETMGIPKGKVAQQILSELMAQDGIKTLNNYGSDVRGQLASDMEKLTLAAIALPSYESFIANNAGLLKGAGSNKSKFFRTVVSKLTSLRNHAKGAAHEITVELGASAADGIIRKHLAKIGVEVVGATNTGGGYSSGLRGLGWLGVEQRMDGALSQPVSEEDIAFQRARNKGDVGVSIMIDNNGNGRVEADIGFNIKNYSKIVNGRFKSYTIHDEGSFSALYRVAFPDDVNYQYLFNIGAGHTSAKNFDSGLTGKKLDSAWNDIIRTVAVSNLTYAMAGNITENVLFMVLNRKIFPISYVLERILNYIKSGEGDYKSITDTDNWFGYGQQIRGISRSKFMAVSKWKGDRKGGWITWSAPYGTGSKPASADPVLAQERSSEARDSLQSLLSKATMSISLRTLASMVQ